MVRDHIEMDSMAAIRLHLVYTKQSEGWQYSLPTSSKVAALIVGDFGVENFEHNIIVEHD